MKNRIALIVVALLLFSGCHTTSADPSPSPIPTPIITPVPTPIPPTPTPAPKPTPEPTQSVDLEVPPDELPYLPEGPILLPEDIVVDGIPLFESGDRIREQYGEPAKIEEYMSEVDASINYVWHYDFGWVYLTESSDGANTEWTGMQFTDPAISAPRDICVGDSVEEILASFPNHNEYQDEEIMIFYRYNTGSSYPIAVPPSGMMRLNDDGSSTYLFNYPLSLMGYQMSIENIEENYIYNNMVDIRYTVQNGIIQQIEIYSGAYGE